MTVLVICGSKYVGDQIVEFLHQLDNVTIVGNIQQANDAIPFYSSLNPQIVILGAELNGGKGITVLDNLKSLDASALVIMTSVSTYIQYRRECLKHGADYFFKIPDEMTALGKTIQQLAINNNIFESKTITNE